MGGLDNSIFKKRRERLDVYNAPRANGIPTLMGAGSWPMGFARDVSMGRSGVCNPIRMGA